MDQVPSFGSEIQITQYLFAWGRNKDGELSIGNQKKSNQPKPVQGIKNYQVSDLGAGQNHSAIITTEGQILVCGSALHGKLGLDDQNQPSYPRFQLVQALKGMVVKQVATGDYHTLCLLDDGQVYAWGGTLHKKLGQRAGKPAKVESLKLAISQIGCGDFHSAALTNDGQLFTWGGGGRDYNHGQLGHGHLNDVEVPLKVKEGIVKFSCGGYHMMALDKDSELWSWGSGMYGETGQGEFQDCLVPKRVKLSFNQKSVIVDDLYLQNKMDSMIKDIKCGGHHTLLLSTKGLVYSCGFAQHGQLGFRISENQNKLQLIVGLVGKTIVQIAAGWNHSLVLSSNSDIYSCGYNQAGQLGVGDEESRTTFTRVVNLEQRRIKQIYAGGNHSWVLLDYNHPIIDNYSPPSPVKEEQKYESSQPQQQQPVELLNDLEVLITEVKLNHRFLKITIHPQQEPQLKQKINDYLNIMQKDPAVKLTKYQNDQEASGIKDNNSLQFTVMMVVDLQQLKTDMHVLDDGRLTSIGRSFIIKRSTFKKNLLYDWINQAEKIMVIPGIQIKYLELRPQ